MNIIVDIRPAHLTNKVLADVATVTKACLGLNEFIANPSLGVLELKRFGSDGLTKEEVKAYWNKVVETLQPYYDITVKKDTLTIYTKGSLIKPNVVLATADEVKQTEEMNEDAGHKETEQKTKGRLAKLFSRKPTKVQK